MENVNNTRPGVKAGVSLAGFDDEERKIVDLISSKYWYITRCQNVRIAKNYSYKTILAKPVDYISQCFNINREVVIIFSPYETFQPRTLDVLDQMDIQNLRVEEICSIVISKDTNVERTVTSLLKVNKESRIIIPFTYNELLSKEIDSDYIVNKFRALFYCRDLFGIQDPLKKDLYFFGRRELIHSIVNKHLNGENIGIFGLRKTGKTSIIYGVRRTLDIKRSISVFVDCQTLHLKSWNIALYSIIESIRDEINVKKSDIHSLSDYQQTMFVSDYFKDDIKKLYRKSGKKSFLIIFDEIENITFKTSSSENWKSGDDYLKFWQIIRSTYQTYSDDNIFSYLIAGTNPQCVEQPKVNHNDNPIFAQFTPIYITPFTYDQTKEMLDKLGGYMGLIFDPETCAHIVEDFGGHPLLIRQMCSYIHTQINGTRPTHVDRYIYKKCKSEFYESDNGLRKYAQMVLEVLSDWYPDEYDMLNWLALEEYKTFNEFAESSPEYIQHLIKYGIIINTEHGYDFKIEAIKSYLSTRNKYKKLTLTNEEKQAEISARRNALESQLRIIVRRQLKYTLGEEAAKEAVITVMYGKTKISQYLATPYEDLFDSNKHKILFRILADIIAKHYDKFQHIFETNVEIFKVKAEIINHLRKTDAHASTIDDSDFKMFRGAMEWFEDKINKY
ncbi:AAA-like domain-containing protein [Alistipes sp.]|uniref:AAA-like domain-containing protein n=1 Tax=Alistipes sp. TaxID=1872444 RepID=UPI0025B7DEF1|nr:AAA-like domain-containing protein [Alistipes sp.]